MARVHPKNQTPSTAIITVGIATALAMLLGEAGLVPILEVGALAAAVGWMSACAAVLAHESELARSRRRCLWLAGHGTDGPG